MADQAEALRKLMEESQSRRPSVKGLVKIYAVVSGKGGVGKTNVSVNLAIAMAQKGKKVLLMDADIGMTNADILMGCSFEYDLFDYIEGRVPLEDIIYDGPQGIKVVSGGSGLLKMETLEHEVQVKLIEGLLSLGDFEILVIDNGAGISRESLSFITFAHEVLLVTTPEPTAITDAYRVLKAIKHYNLQSSVKLIVNKVPSREAGEETFGKLQTTAREFLGLGLDKAGYIYDDIRVSKSIMEQEPVIMSYPQALSSGNIRDIAALLLEEGVFVQNVSTLKQLGNRFMKIFGS